MGLSGLTWTAGGRSRIQVGDAEATTEMADVVKFETKSEPKSESSDLHEYVWTCNACGCQSFQLLSTGFTICVRCGCGRRKLRRVPRPAGGAS